MHFKRVYFVFFLTTVAPSTMGIWGLEKIQKWHLVANLWIKVTFCFFLLQKYKPTGWKKVTEFVLKVQTIETNNAKNLELKYTFYLCDLQSVWIIFNALVIPFNDPNSWGL